MPPKIGRCRSCHARVIWATTTNARPMPVDAKPNPAGQLVLHDVPGCPPLAIHVSKPAQPGEARYMSHFATCPAAAQHRQR